MRIAVTGADGFVGRRTVVAARVAGHDVLPLVRSIRIDSDPSSLAFGDIGTGPAWTDPLSRCDAIIHLAAAVHDAGPEPDDRARWIRATNVDGTVRLARMAAECGVARLVFASSIKVMGEASSRAFVEDDLPQPVGAYAVSKRDAETALRSVGDSTQLQVAILRPPLVYGPGVGANFYRLMRLCDSPWPLPLAGDRALRSMIYVDNLAHALVVAATHPVAANETFFVTDGGDSSVAELVRRIRRLLNRPERLFSAPRGLIALGARAVGQGDALTRLLTPLQASSARFCGRLGWRPPHSQTSGLAATVEWFRSRTSRRQP
jgi:nucleoside-diphosphate-sugar epimerase